MALVVHGDDHGTADSAPHASDAKVCVDASRAGGKPGCSGSVTTVREALNSSGDTSRSNRATKNHIRLKTLVVVAAVAVSLAAVRDPHPNDAFVHYLPADVDAVPRPVSRSSCGAALDTAPTEQPKP